MIESLLQGRMDVGSREQQASPGYSSSVCNDPPSTKSGHTVRILYPNILSAPAPVLRQNGAIWVDEETVCYAPLPSALSINVTPGPFPDQNKCDGGLAQTQSPTFQQPRHNPEPSLRSPRTPLEIACLAEAPPTHIDVPAHYDTNEDEGGFDDNSTIATCTLDLPPGFGLQRSPEPKPTSYPDYYTRRRSMSSTSSGDGAVAPTSPTARRLNSKMQESKTVRASFLKLMPTTTTNSSDEDEDSLEDHPKNSVTPNAPQPLSTVPIPRPTLNSKKDTLPPNFDECSYYKPITAEEYLQGKKSVTYMVSTPSSTILKERLLQSQSNQNCTENDSNSSKKKSRRKGATVAAGVAGGVFGLLLLGPLGAVAAGVGSAAATRILGKRLEKRSRKQRRKNHHHFHWRSDTSSVL